VACSSPLLNDGAPDRQQLSLKAKTFFRSIGGRFLIFCYKLGRSGVEVDVSSKQYFN